MLHLICQWLMVASTIFSLFINLHWDVNGKPARKPMGFGGVVCWENNSYALAVIEGPLKAPIAQKKV